MASDHRVRVAGFLLVLGAGLSGPSLPAGCESRSAQSASTPPRTIIQAGGAKGILSASLTRTDRSTVVRIDWPKLDRPLIVLAQVAGDTPLQSYANEVPANGGVLAVACGSAPGHASFAIDEAASRAAFGENLIIRVELLAHRRVSMDFNLFDRELRAKFGRVPVALSSVVVPGEFVLVTNDRPPTARWLVSDLPRWLGPSIQAEPTVYRIIGEEQWMDLIHLRHIGAGAWQAEAIDPVEPVRVP